MPPASSPERVRPINVFLAREEFRDPDDLFRDRGSYKFEQVFNRDGFVGVLYTRASRPRPPDWLSFFEGAMPDPEFLSNLLTASAAAVLHLECGGRTFLITFGYGRNMIADGVVEPRFGLKATLNAIDPNRLRSLDRKSFERIQRHSREQLSRDAGFHAFGVDVERDLLCAVVGTPTDPDYGRRLAGRDSLTTFTAATIDDLPTLLELLLLKSEEGAYQERFPWVDNIAEVGDRRTRDWLDLQLVTKIRRGDVEDVVLAPPELIEWERFDSFRYRSSAGAGDYSDLSWEEYAGEVRDLASFATQHLRSDKIFCVRADGPGFLDTWALRRCIVAELDVGGTHYVISDGRWYRIDRNFAVDIAAAIGALQPCVEPFSPYGHRDEHHYNSEMARASGGRWALTDRRTISTRTAHGSIEFCDLYSDQRRIIHVKRYGGSAPLSHLFAQGVVSARLFVSDPEFREAVNEILPDSHRLPNCRAAIDPHEYEVAYVVLDRPGREKDLPFFSMVNLKGATEMLRGFGYRVSLTRP